jgi:alkanesulfonate monooxygenase SsuD/methylene tetrahydromethanopterin reductase-like flavin-dependent oxidoreductase (luciferase family)
MENHGADPTTRGRMVNERLRAMRELWTKERAEFHGEFVDFDPVFSWPEPVQSPHPPIYVGGAEGAFNRVAEFGDAWLANRTTPEKLAPLIGKMRSIAGRDVPVTVYAATDDPATIEGFTKLDVERLLLYLPTLPENESLQVLDRLAAVADRFS